METKKTTGIPYEEPHMEVIEIEEQEGILSASTNASIEGFGEQEEIW